MSDQWAIRMPRASLIFAGALRLKKIDVCERGETFWLRSSEPVQALQSALGTLPHAERFDIGPGGALFPPGSRVPPTGPLGPMKEAHRSGGPPSART